MAAVLLAGCGSTVVAGQQVGGVTQEPGLSVGPATSASLGGAGPSAGGPTTARSLGAPQTYAAAAPAGSGSVGVGPSAVLAPQGADRRPISVGILYTNNDAAAGAGVNNGNTFTPRNAFDALIAAWNARGGLAGRRIDPVFVELKSSSSNLSADMQAACVTFTQDHHVAVVLSTAGIYFEAFARCLAAASTPVVTGDYAVGDDQALRATPGYLTPATITTDQRMRVLLQHLAMTGHFTKSDKLGVVVEGCPYNQRTYDQTVVPVARRLGLTIADHFVGRCLQGLPDFGGLASDMQNAVLRFKTDGVTQVTFVSGGVEGDLMLLFATAAQSQAFRPGYGLTSAAAPVIQEANTPKAQLANAVGLGWLPSLDTSQASPTALAAQRRCATDLYQGGGLTAASPADRYFAFSTCDTFSFYDAALRGSHGATRSADVLAAVARLGSGLQLAAPFAGAVDFGNGRQTGPAEARDFAWSTTCGCFDYTGSPFSLLTP